MNPIKKRTKIMTDMQSPCGAHTGHDSLIL
jgi:hypothetical protein